MLALVGAGVGVGFVAVVGVAAAALAALAAAFFCAFVSLALDGVVGVVLCASTGCANARLAETIEPRAMILMSLIFMVIGPP